MSTPAHPGRNLFVTLPVADLERSKAFFTALGFVFNPNFGDESSACMLVGEQAFVMLGTNERFAQVSKRPMGDPATHALATYTFSVPNRDDVNQLVDAALAAGAVEADPFEDLGFMCSRAFFDLDGHGWNIMWMDPAAVESGPPADAH
jgi:predicted lactoylglutathione lyase